jgi:hypothetical protein
MPVGRPGQDLGAVAGERSITSSATMLSTNCASEEES